MSDSPDLKPLLASWPFDPDHNSRIITGLDGRSVLQIRTPLGIEQYELVGRPDGQRSHGMESALDYQRQRLAQAETSDAVAAFRLSANECAELFEEGVLYYYRYLHLFQLKQWSLVARDTARNLAVFDLVHRFAKREEDRQHLEQWRPYILRVNAVARAMLDWEAGRHPAARKIVQLALDEIERLPDLEQETFQYERQRSLEALRELAGQIEKTQPITQTKLLERELRTAVEAQEFERAAVLRDRIHALRDNSAAS